MFAVIESGSHQLRVETGQVLSIDFRAGSEPGENIAFDRVLLANAGGASAIGRPLIDGAVVEAQIVDPEVKGEKLEIQKLRRRKNSKRHTGHRQKYTRVKITAINVPGLDIVDDGLATGADSAEASTTEDANQTETATNDSGSDSGDE